MRPFLGLALLGLAAVAAGWGYLRFQIERPLALDAPLIFELRSGTTVTDVARQLEAKGLMQTPELLFRIHARLTRDAGFPKAGEYRLTPGLTTASALALFRSGRVIERTVTFPEGWTFAEWRQHLVTKPRLERTTIDWSDDQIMARIGRPGIAAEGQFFPDTYRYTAGESDLSILRRAHQRMAALLDAEWQTRTAGDVIETPYEALILASIVEKETGDPADRRPIAGVFFNRLNDGMRLQSDPTVIYGIADFDGDLRRADLRQRTPFNTYVIRGLPPTPICNPGIDSIRAVMHPESVPYRYFVARGDGTSEFSVTLEEHNRAVARYQLGQ